MREQEVKEIISVEILKRMQDQSAASVLRDILFDNDNKYLRVLDDWFPRLYALLKNKKNLKEYVDTEDTYLFYDFVNIN